MRVALFYFTGTGNTEFAAREYQAAFGPDHPTELHNIEFPLRQDLARLLDQSDMLGFGAPVYGFCVPRPFADFVRRLPRQPARPAFIFVTCGGGPGAALDLPARRLSRAGYVIRDETVLQMPSNVFISAREDDELVFRLLGWTGRTSISKELERCRAEVRHSVARIVDNNGRPQPSTVGGRLSTALFGPMIHHTGWSMRFQLRVTRECNRCGLCVYSCPMGNIVPTARSVSYRWHCAYCLRCLNLCPKHAIRMRFPFSAFDNRVQYLCPGWTPPRHACPSGPARSAR